MPNVNVVHFFEFDPRRMVLGIKPHMVDKVLRCWIRRARAARARSAPTTAVREGNLFDCTFTLFFPSGSRF